MLKWILGAALWLVVAAKQPHILYVVVDDMGWSDIGFPEGADGSIKTPFIDHYATSGLILNRHYSAWCCTPTRASIFTGRYPISLGIQHDVFMTRSEECLTMTQHLLPEIVRSNGYATHMIGKWHLGYPRWDCLPCRRGFDTWMGYINGQTSYLGHYLGNYVDFMKCSDNPDTGLEFNVLSNLAGTYSMDIYQAEALKLIKHHNASQPLFLNLMVQTPHSPFYSPTKYMVEGCYSDRCVMQGMMKATEVYMEAVINSLKEKDMWNNTIMIFHSDNGAQESDFNSNYPLKGWKSALWEGGIRNPAFVYSENEQLMPNRGVKSNAHIHVSDWYKTIITFSGGWSNWRAAGKEMPLDLDSIDQSGHILYGEPGPRRSIMLHIDPVMRVAAYIKDDYKLLIGDQDSSATCRSTMVYPMNEMSIDWDIIKLYDVFSDPSETTDVHDDYPSITTVMSEELKSFLNHQKPMQCQLAMVDGAYPNSDVPYYLPWDFSAPGNKSDGGMPGYGYV